MTAFFNSLYTSSRHLWSRANAVANTSAISKASFQDMVLDLLYTLSILHSKGEIEEVNEDAIKTLIAKRSGTFNEMIGRALMLPSEINLIYSNAST